MVRLTHVPSTRRAALALLASPLVLALAPEPSSGRDPGDLQSVAALVMIEDKGCPYCAKFDAEVREGYERSSEGRFAPLVRRPRQASDIAFIGGVVYSPTFVLLVGGREVGRIVGYAGAELFWMDIATVMSKAGFRPSKGGQATTG